MNERISAERRDGIWYLSRAPALALAPDDEALLRRSLELGRARVTDMYDTLGTAAGVWRLELPKACLGEGEIALGLAAELARRCRAAPDAAHAMLAPAHLVSRRSIERALEAQGERVASAWPDAALDRLRFGAATLVAAAVWVATLLRTLGDTGRPPAGVALLVAAHGESTTRTRHVLALLPTDAAGSAVMVLGRPRTSLAALARGWSERTGAQGLRPFRPFGVGAALRSLPRAIGLCVVGARLIADQPFVPGFASQVAMAYRCFLGAAAARWWERSGIEAATVVYGHSGLADTTLLEEAQQAAGVRTVHAVHGVSGGVNFTARSDLGLFRCGFDARWHEALGGYRACRATVEARPTSTGGAAGLLFLSNHLHPMDPWYRAFGARDELAALAEVAAAAATLGIPRDAVVWKPHPAFGSLPQAVQAEALERVASLGLRRWADGDSLAPAARFELVVTTRSTVALDLLRRGVLPIVLDLHPGDLGDALAAFPLQAQDRAGIVATAVRLRDAAQRDALFDACWATVGPSAALEVGSCHA